MQKMEKVKGTVMQKTEKVKGTVMQKMEKVGQKCRTWRKLRGQ